MKFFTGAFVVAGIIVAINGGGDRAKICESDLDVGWTCDSSPSKQLFYFDNVNHICRDFIYLGCGGNANKFETPFGCESFCVSGDPATNTTGLSKPSDSGTIDDGEEVVGWAGQ